MSDIEIARNAKLKNIVEVAKSIDINEEDLELYGKYKAKISDNVYTDLKDKKDGKLVLVTAINPTPLGEGKTTMSIGLADGLRKIGKKSILALREPSLGPVFGMKGGATGGGYSQIAPMEDINLHFTGDLHAITTANNLLSAMIDNHIYFGNELKIKRVVWTRCLDLNDRQLRVVNTGLSEEKNILPRIDGFNITVASEIMAILCLAKDLNDLIKNIEFNVLSDVSSPILGEEGGLRVYTPQKGATKEDLDIMENNIKSYLNTVIDQVNSSYIDDAYLGAAGGINYSLKYFLNAKIKLGISALLEIIKFDKLIKEYDIIISGEGKFDYQTLQGKVIKGIMKYHPKRLVIISAINELLNTNMEVYSIVPNIASAEESLKYPKENLQKLIETLNL